MQSIYSEGTSPLHRLHPLTKLAGFLLVVGVAFVLPVLAVQALALLCVAISAAVAGVPGRVARMSLVILLPLLVSLFVIQGLLFPPTRTTMLFETPWLTIWADGFLFALGVLLRLLLLTWGVLLVLITTHPADLVAALEGIGLPRAVGYVLLVAIQLVPDMSARATAILEAQRSRGLNTDGFVRRIRSLVPLIGPLIVGALADVEERAMALEERAFTASGPKTTLRELADSGAQRVARVGLMIVLVALIVARFTVLRGLL
jgi:energy-coupling factor transport system permease protein